MWIWKLRRIDEGTDFNSDGEDTEENSDSALWERYWDEIINFEAMLQWNMVSLEDLDLFQFVGSPEEAVNYNSTAHKGWGVAAYCHAPADAQTSFNNQAFSSKRIYVEHVIGKLKVLAIFCQPYRNRG